MAQKAQIFDLDRYKQALNTAMQEQAVKDAKKVAIMAAHVSIKPIDPQTADTEKIVQIQILTKTHDSPESYYDPGSQTEELPAAQIAEVQKRLDHEPEPTQECLPVVQVNENHSQQTVDDSKPDITSGFKKLLKALKAKCRFGLKKHPRT